MCDLGLFRVADATCPLPPLGVFANLATTIGVVLAVLAAWIAYVSHRRSAKDAAASHMHGLFRDYLRLRLEWSRQEGVKSRTDGDGIGQLVSFKLYTLEEMYAWVDRHRPLKVFRPLFPYTMSNIRGWEQTIVYHLREDAATGAPDRPERSIQSLSEYESCYGDRFLIFAMGNLGEDLHQALRRHNPKRARRLKLLLDEQIARLEVCP